MTKKLMHDKMSGGGGGGEGVRVWCVCVSVCGGGVEGGERSGSRLVKTRTVVRQFAHSARSTP